MHTHKYYLYFFLKLIFFKYDLQNIHVSRLLPFLWQSMHPNLNYFVMSMYIFCALPLERFWFFHTDDWYNVDIFSRCRLWWRREGEGKKVTIHVRFKLSFTGIEYYNRKVTGNNFHTYTCIFISWINTIPYMWSIIAHFNGYYV